MPRLIRDRYEPLEVAGRGGQGEVLKALDRQHGRYVAVKVRPVGSDAEREALLQEARILLNLTPHVGVPLVRDDFFEGGRYHLVMDWIDGRNLRAKVDAEGPISYEEVVRLLRPVAEALDHLHAQDRVVVHRDVKPGNVVVTRAGRVVLVDFGIAGPVSPSRTGTRNYVAPEVLAGAPATPAADVFGLAATAYALLAGNAPMPGAAGPRWSDMPAAHAERAARALELGLSMDPALRPRSASAFVALLAPLATPHNVPAETSSFVGRSSELAALGSALSAGRMVTLVGAGGCGKTRLALRAARDALGEYPDGVYLAELGALSRAELVAHEVARAVGADVGASPQDDIVRSIGDGDVLLVIDNCEHLGEACARLAHLVLRSCPRVHVLATSREPLEVEGEQIWWVPPLAAPAGSGTQTAQDVERYGAVQLFCDRARAALPSFVLTDAEAPAVSRICARVDGLPLAIEMAGAAVRSLSVSDIAARLEGALAVLGASRAAVPRHRTLRATLDWSYDLLVRDEQELLSRLSVFRGGFSAKAAEEVCGGEGLARHDVVPLLARLVDKSLVVAEARADTHRYRLLETVREYANEKAGDTQPLTARHAAWFASLAEEAFDAAHGPDHAAWTSSLETEHDNVRAALDHFADDPDGADAGLVFAARLSSFWESRGFVTEGRAQVARALSRSEASEPARATGLLAAGWLAYLQGDYDEADLTLGEALRLMRGRDLTEGVAGALTNLGSVALARGDLGRAESLFQESMRTYAGLGRRWELAGVLNNLAAVAFRRGDYVEAEAKFGECLDLQRDIGDTRTASQTLANLATLAMARGDLPAARGLLEESLSLQGDGGQTAFVLTKLGDVARIEGHDGRARELYARALTLHESAGDRRGAAYTLLELGELERGAGRMPEAVTAYERSLGLWRELGDKRGEANTLCNLGHTELAHDARAAQEFFDAGLAIWRTLDDPLGIAAAIEGLAEARAAAGDAEAAARLVGVAGSMREELGRPVDASDAADLEAAIAQIRAALGDKRFYALRDEGARTPHGVLV